MKKGFFVLGITALVVAAALGVLYFVGAKQAQAPEAPAYTIPPEEMRNPEEIVVEGNRFTDTREHYSGIIPEGWSIEKPDTIQKGISFYGPIVSEKGCKIVSDFLVGDHAPAYFIDQRKLDLEYMTVRSKEEGDVSIAEYQGKYFQVQSDELGFSKSIYLYVNDKTFGVGLFAQSDIKDSCLAVFSEFITKLDFRKS